jgi:hypothetical protein
MKSFFKSKHCTSRKHCQSCRNIDSESFRKSIYEAFDDVEEVNFECPFGKAWGVVEKKEEPKKEQVNQPRTMVDGKYIMANLDKFDYIPDLRNRAESVDEQVKKAKCTRCKKNKLLRRLSDYALAQMKVLQDYSAVEDLQQETSYVIYKNKGYFLKDWMELDK